MEVKILGVKGTWQEVKNASMNTIGKETGKNPDSSWKRRMLLAEHSPIRKLIINWKFYGLLSWVSVHFVRHKIGIEHWVRSQRADRNAEIVDRNEAKQGNLIDHEMEANAQSIINISRKRLCLCASMETRFAWQEFLESFKNAEPELYNACVPDCIYRGYCYEFSSCNYHKSPQFKERLAKYREGINE